MTTPADQPRRRFVAGDLIPFTPAELRELLGPVAEPGAVITADLVNLALARIEGPDGELPPEWQARLDRGQTAQIAAEWRARW